jgi:hypothetical protein
MKYLKYFEDNIPGNTSMKKQLHVFDFDDTLGVTKNANGVMLYKKGSAAHKSPEEVLDWLSEYGLSESDLIPGPDGKEIQFFDNHGGYAAYVDSAKLAKLTGVFPKSNRFSTEKNGVFMTPPADVDQALYIDFTPSGFIDLETTKPIKNVIKKLTDAEEAGADTMVLTARSGSGVGINFKGEKVPVTNQKDMEDFLKKYDDNPSTKPVDLVVGVTGGDKGKYIGQHVNVLRKDDFDQKSIPDVIDNKIKRLGDIPDEIHFYDDARQNTDAVEKGLRNKVPSEIYIYGPGEFAKGHADPNSPDKSFPNKGVTKLNNLKIKRFLDQ